MKVSAVTSYSYNTKQNIVKHKAQVPNESNNVDQDVTFKGNLWSAFGAAGGAVIGGLFAGPLGAIAAASLFGAAGSAIPDKDNSDDSSGYPSDSLRTTNY